MRITGVGKFLLIAFFAAFGITGPTAAADQASGTQPSKQVASSADAGSTQKPADAKPPASGGLLVFIDPATGKVVRPSEADMRKLSGTPAPRVAVPSQEHYIQGPGNAVGVRLDPSSFSYSVATRTADGKIGLDCVSGENAANSRVSEGTHRDSAVKAKPKAASDDK